MGQISFSHHTLHTDTLVFAASLSYPSRSGSRLRQKRKTFHIPENTSTIQQLQTLTKSIIVRHEGQQAHKHTHQPRTLSCPLMHTKIVSPKTHTSSQNHTTDYKQLGLDSDLLYTTTSSAKVSGG